MQGYGADVLRQTEMIATSTGVGSAWAARVSVVLARPPPLTGELAGLWRTFHRHHQRSGRAGTAQKWRIFGPDGKR